MKAKQTLRFVVAGIFLALFIFGVWAIFFNPDKKIPLNERLANVHLFNQTYEVDEMLAEVEEIWKNGIDGESLNNDVKTTLNKIFYNQNTTKTQTTAGCMDNPFSGYNYYNSKLTEAYDFYSVYANTVSSISSNRLRVLKSDINNYKSSVQNLSQSLKDLKAFIASKPENAENAWYGSMRESCNGVCRSYVYLLYRYSVLCETVRDICIDYAFGETYLNTTSSILYDSIIYQSYWTFFNSVEDSSQEEYRIVDLELFCKLSDRFNKNENIFSSLDVTEVGLINNYTTMQNEYADKLSDYFMQIRENKYLLYTGSVSTVYTHFAACYANIQVLNKLMFSMYNLIMNT